MKQVTLTLAGLATLALCATQAHADFFPDTYWGAGKPGIQNTGVAAADPARSGDVYDIDGEGYDISGISASLSGKILTATIHADHYFDNIRTKHTMYMPGDLFLSTSGWNPSGSAADHYNTHSTMADTNWDYVVNFADIVTQTQAGADSGAASLYKTEDGAIESGLARTAQMAWFTPSQTAGVIANGSWEYIKDSAGHYSLHIMIDLAGMAWDPSSQPLGLYWNMECGNDAVAAQLAPVPEPTSLLLLGAGLGGLCLAGRRRMP